MIELNPSEKALFCYSIEFRISLQHKLNDVRHDKLNGARHDKLNDVRNVKLNRINSN
jgi:hypothetical protein